MARWRALEARLRKKAGLKEGLIERARQMTPLLLFLLGCAVTYLGTVSAAFNALMRLSLRIHAERTDRDDALGWYLEDPRRLFIPARLLISTLTILAAALLARVTGLDRAGFPVLDPSRSSSSCSRSEHLIPLLIVRQRSRARARRAAAVVRRDCAGAEAADVGLAAPRHEQPPPQHVGRAHRRARAARRRRPSKSPPRPRNVAAPTPTPPRPCRKGRRASCSATSPTSARRWCAR